MIYAFDINDHHPRKPRAGKTRWYASWNTGSEIGYRFVIYIIFRRGASIVYKLQKDSVMG